MTNRTEALEQIWLEDLEEDTKGFIGYAWGSPIKGLLEPYIRADLSDAMKSRIAKLEAELYAMTEDRNIVLETSQQQFIHTVELEAKLAKSVEHAFKEGLRYSINVDIRSESDVKHSWDWSRLKQTTLAELKGETDE